MRPLALLLLISAFVPAVWAADSVDALRAYQTEVKARLADRDNEFYSAGHRQRIADMQSQIDALLAGPFDAGKASDLRSQIDEQLADAELDRQVCRGERATGSNRLTRVCRTKRQELEMQRRIQMSNNGAMSDYTTRRGN